MLIRHSALYLIAKLIPGLVHFLSLAVFTRLLSPEDYGYYALVFAVVQLVNALLFQWLRVSLIRFLPQTSPRGLLLQSGLQGFIFTTMSLSILSAFIALFLSAQLSTGEVLLGLGLLVALAWHELNLEVLRAELHAYRYLVWTVLRSILSLIIGVVLIYLGFGAQGVLLGAMLGLVLPSLIATVRTWPWQKLFAIHAPTLQKLLQYGLPLTLTFALSFIINGSDRLLIAWLLDTEALGLYSVGYDLGRQTIFLLLMGVSLASFPLAVKALESKGIEAASRELQKNATLMLMLGVPATVGLVTVAPNLTHNLLGDAFQESKHIIPLVAVAALVSGFREFHVNRAFQLSNHTRGLIMPTALAAVSNLALNFLFIPRWGIAGAAVATLIAYTISTVVTWQLGRKLFPIAISIPDTNKIIIATALMWLALLPMQAWLGLGPLLIQVLIGIFVFATSTVLLDTAGVRALLLKGLSKKQ